MHQIVEYPCLNPWVSLRYMTTEQPVMKARLLWGLNAVLAEVDQDCSYKRN